MLFQKTADRLASKQLYVCCFFWVVTCLVYLPAAKAGFVSDTTGWLQSLTQDSFRDYISRSRFSVKSMYQLTQLNTWLLYQLIGSSHLAWHLVHVTLHACVCLLLYQFCRTLFRASGIGRPHLPALGAALLFCVNPYASEVVVWEASFHYMQALLLIFGILLLVQRYQERPARRYAWGAGFLFFLSTFTHELFYLSPALTLSLLLYNRLALQRDPSLLKRSLLWFTLPQLGLFLLHLALLRITYGSGVAHTGTRLFDNPPGYFLVKPPWCFFHVFAWGRFFPASVRSAVYDLFRTAGGAVFFYGSILLICSFVAMRWRKMDNQVRLISYLFLCVLIAQSILMPLWFPETLLVLGDRYLYLMLAFHALLIAAVLYRIRISWLKQCLWVLFLGINVCLTWRLSTTWGQSEQIITALQTSKQLKNGTVNILLNSPASLQGIPMIGATAEGEFRLMHNLLFAPPVYDTLMEVAAYNMATPGDGATAVVIDDHTIQVSLPEKTARWWRNGNFPATSYENEWYRVNIAASGNCYYLILKRPSSEYNLLLQRGPGIKVVDMAIKSRMQY